MRVEIIATIQAKLLLYRQEANVLIDALKSVEAPDSYSKDVISGVIKELKKVNNYKV